jgi:hypothetical protein
VGGYKAGDKVLVKQEKKNKLSSFFNSEQFRVLQKNGNSVLVEARILGCNISGTLRMSRNW